MKKLTCLLVLVAMLFCGCSQWIKEPFEYDKSNHTVNVEGEKYAFLANEAILYYLGELELVGRVQGDEADFTHLGMLIKPGMYRMKDSQTDNVLVRYAPNNEFFALYRKASLPKLDFSLDNCSRIEIVEGHRDLEKDAVHKTCRKGIADKSEIAAFLTDVKAQKSPEEAGLYELVKQPNGLLENCYVSHVIYGFF